MNNPRTIRQNFNQTQVLNALVLAMLAQRGITYVGPVETAVYVVNPGQPELCNTRVEVTIEEDRIEITPPRNNP